MINTYKAGSPGDYLIVEDPQKPTTWHLQVKRNGTVDHGLMGAAWAALHTGFRGNTYQGPNKGEAISKLRALYRAENMPIPGEKSFSVFKDASGAYRWLARTTTAYRDRDGEIISSQALEDDIARMQATGQYGPLRYWHVGHPTPLDPQAPWGPGLDIGDCDYSTLIGRTNIESGTFKSAALGAAFADSASTHELSPGFFHALGEPDASGVFHHTRRFERSVVPIQHARASNLFTGLAVGKEHTMDQATYEARVKAYLDFTRKKGLPPDVAAAPLVAMEQADKTADEKQIAYKAVDWFKHFLAGAAPEQPAEKAAPAPEPEPAPEAPADPLAALSAQLAALQAEIATLKAGGMGGGGMMGMGGGGKGDMMAQDATAALEGDMGAEGDMAMQEDSGGLTLSPDDLAAIGQAVGAGLQQALEPLIGALGIVQKLDGGLGELKSLMAGYVTRKDDTEAQQTADLAAVKAQVAELVGDAPRGGYRPSAATDNTPFADPQLQAAIKGAAANGNGFEDLYQKLFPTIQG